MGRLLPLRTETTRTPSEPRVLDLDGEGADEAFAALSSETARRILATVYEEPRTPTEINEQVGTSLQNVHYHLEKLETADLVQEAGTGYSEKGNEMTVYAPSNEALVLFAGDDHTRTRILDALKRFVSGLAVLAFASLLIAMATGSRLLAGFQSSPSADSASKPTVETGAKITESAGTASQALDPAIAFFLGGVFVLALASCWWYFRG
jgi:DNA-binding transcriptional ArsR family regulator